MLECLLEFLKDCKFLKDCEYLATWSSLLIEIILLAIEIVFLYFLLKEFKMTRKSFELQEEELKNKYCHEVWHLVGDLFFHKLFKFTTEKGKQYVDMMTIFIAQKQTIDREPEYRNIKYELKEEIENSINTYIDQEHINFKKENVADNYKEVFKKYKEIVLTIVEQLSIDLWSRVDCLNDVLRVKQEDEIMRMLEGNRFLVLTGLFTYRKIWGDETILSLHKLLASINVPKCNKN